MTKLDDTKEIAQWLSDNDHMICFLGNIDIILCWEEYRKRKEAEKPRLIPLRKEYQHGRDFFQGEGQEIANANVDGWNQCLSEIRQIANKYKINLKI